jgi:hypothetical protein
MNAINGLSNNSYLQSVMSSALRNAGVNPTATTSTSSATQSDVQQLSPFGQMMSTLQQLQQTDPTKYAQVTNQIATNLQSAAQTAQSQGNTSAANQLNELATDFSNASTSGKMPNFQNLAQAASGTHGHHHGHHGHHADSDSDSSSSTSSSSSTQNQIAAYQSSSAQRSQFNPMTIIGNTLASAGLTQSNS